MEEYAWVIDYLPVGKANEAKREPLVQLIGHQFFTLLEAKVKRDATVSIGEKVYVGKGQRDVIGRIKGRLNYDELTETAKENLPIVLKQLVKEREKYFLAFLNKAGPLSVRVHQLELLPGIGKKHLKEILEEREKKPFESFEEVKQRIKSFPDPIMMFAERIIDEVSGQEKHLFFVKKFRHRLGP